MDSCSALLYSDVLLMSVPKSIPSITSFFFGRGGGFGMVKDPCGWIRWWTLEEGSTLADYK